MLIEKKYSYNTDLVSQIQFDEHYKLYKNYVKNINNQISEIQLDTYSANSIILHQLYFENITKTNELKSEFMINFFNEHFNGYKNWKRNFSELSLKTKNRGWVLMICDSLTNSYRNIVMDAHDCNLTFLIEPKLVNDLYEHTFFISYGSNKKEYIDNFFKCIDWQVIEKRIKNIYML